MKTKAKSRTSPKAKAAPTARAKSKAGAKRKAKASATAKRKPAAKPAAKRKATAKPAAKPKARAKPAAKGNAKARAKAPASAAPSKWVAFVEKHGVVLASAKGALPSVAEAVAGEPIVGSWWSHPKAQVIFDALSEIDDDVDVRCFKLVDGKVTFVHRRLWPALVRLAREGRLSAERVACVQQEHLPDGEHRNLVTPFPDWVPEEVAAAADDLSSDAARAQLGAWV